MIEIWGRSNSINVQKIMWTVAELDIDHVRHDAGMAFGVVGTEEFAAMNPNRKVPTIKDGDLILWESNAIVRYLAAKYGGSTFWREDAGKRALLDRWHDWAATAIMVDLKPIFWGMIRTPEADRNMDEINAAIDAAGKTMAILDSALTNSQYLESDALSFADIPAGVATYRYFALPIDRPSLPQVEAWYARLTERPAFREHVMIALS